MAPSSPTVAQHELALRLTRRRLELDLNVATLAKELGFTRNYWSAIENKRTLPAKEKLQDVVKLLKFDDEAQFELLQLREIARSRGWWDEQPYSSVLSEDTKILAGFEQGATGIRSYESLVIPGLLQTEEYARAVLAADSLHAPATLETRVAARKRRQRRLSGDEPLRLTAVLSETTLLQQVAGPNIQRRQLEYLATLVESRPETLIVQILPFSVFPGGLIGSLSLSFLEFASSHLPVLALQEGYRELLLPEGAELTRIELAWAAGLDKAVAPDESLDLIRKVVSQLA